MVSPREDDDLGARPPICPGCFRPKGAIDMCPHCGYDTSAPRRAGLLPWLTLLNGRYLVGRELTGWGREPISGVLYLAWDKAENRPVIVKEFAPRTAAGPGPGASELMNRFLGAAATIARLGNLNLEPVRDAFHMGGRAYAARDFTPGMSLADYLSGTGGPIPEARAIAVTLPILDALRELHAAGLAHGDVRPETVFLAEFNRPVLFDFGVVAGGDPRADVQACAALLGRMAGGRSPGLVALLERPPLDAAAFRQALLALRDGGAPQANASPSPFGTPAPGPPGSGSGNAPESFGPGWDEPADGTAWGEPADGSGTLEPDGRAANGWGEMRRAPAGHGLNWIEKTAGIFFGRFGTWLLASLLMALAQGLCMALYWWLENGGPPTIRHINNSYAIRAGYCICAFQLVMQFAGSVARMADRQLRGETIRAWDVFAACDREHPAKTPLVVKCVLLYVGLSAIAAATRWSALFDLESVGWSGFVCAALVAFALSRRSSGLLLISWWVILYWLVLSAAFGGLAAGADNFGLFKGIFDMGAAAWVGLGFAALAAAFLTLLPAFALFLAPSLSAMTGERALICLQKALRACAVNWAALLLCGLPMMILGPPIALLGVFFGAFFPILGYVACRDIFCREDR